MGRAERPKDAVFNKFVGPVMADVVKLVADFDSQEAATAFYVKLLKRQRVKKMLTIRFPYPDHQPTGNALGFHKSNHYYFCWWQADNGPKLSDGRQNPLELLHLFAHIVQPPDSAMHKREFGKIFLSLVELVYDADMKRAVKDLLLAHNIKTTALTSETRERQRDAYFKRRTKTLIGRFVEDE